MFLFISCWNILFIYLKFCLAWSFCKKESNKSLHDHELRTKQCTFILFPDCSSTDVSCPVEIIIFLLILIKLMHSIMILAELIPFYKNILQMFASISQEIIPAIWDFLCEIFIYFWEITLSVDKNLFIYRKKITLLVWL